MSRDTEGVTRRTFLSRAAAAAAFAGAPLPLRAQGEPVPPPEDRHARTPAGDRQIRRRASTAFRSSTRTFICLTAAGRKAPATWARRRIARNPRSRCLRCTRRWPGPPASSGAIIVESSARVEDNDWYLEVSQADPFMVGVSGRLDPYNAQFGENLARLQKNPLYRAIRASRFYTNTDGKVTLDAVAVDNLKLLAQADLAHDTANPSMPLMTANVMLADAIPNLRIIMDHLPSFDPAPDGQAAYEAVVKEMAARPNIFVKLTEVYHPRLDTKQVVGDYMPLRDRLEYLFGMFGEDRVMFGTDYPNSYGVATISEEVGLMKKFFSTKTRAQAEKYFWRNAARIYKYVKRAADQPNL